MSPPPVRSFKRSLFTSYVTELRRTGLFEQVRTGAPPAVGALLDDPRGAPLWLEPEAFDFVNAQVYALRRREGLRDLGYQVMKHGFTRIVEPIVQVSLNVFGGTPDSVFARANLMLSIVSQGVHMTWVPTGPLRGTMQIRCEMKVPDITWVPWEGTLAYGLELAGARGVVKPARIAADGQSCEVDVSWDAR
jgi:hypothetical protein